MCVLWSRSLSVSPKDILDSAMAVNQASEADNRLVASRVYYASYHHSNKFNDSLATKGMVPNNIKGSHEILIQQLQNPAPGPNATRSRQLGYILNTLRRYRINADYHPDQDFTHNDAAESAQLASRCLGI